MTESDWLSSQYPRAMLAYLRDDVNPYFSIRAVSSRKQRLIGCACARQVWELLTDPRSRRAIEIIERFADGLASKSELKQADNEATAAAMAATARDRPQTLPATAAAWIAAWAGDSPVNVAFKLSHSHVGQLAKEGGLVISVADIVRDLFGNPWQPCVVEGTPEEKEQRWRGNVHFGPVQLLRKHWLTWKEAAVPRLARRIYDEHAFDRLPILADALEEAGCADPYILHHLRGFRQTIVCDASSMSAAALASGASEEIVWLPGSGKHARGCWVLDLILNYD